MTVMHVERDEEPNCAHDGDPSWVEVSNGVEEEGGDNTSEYHAALDEKCAVGDRDHLLELGNVDDKLALKMLLEVPGEVLEDDGRAQQHTGGKIEQEGVEVEVLGEHVADDDVWGVTNHRGCAANVGEDGLTDEVRAGVDVDELAQLASDGADEKNRRDVVEESR